MNKDIRGVTIEVGDVITCFNSFTEEMEVSEIVRLFRRRYFQTNKSTWASDKELVVLPKYYKEVMFEDICK